VSEVSYKSIRLIVYDVLIIISCTILVFLFIPVHLNTFNDEFKQQRDNDFVLTWVLENPYPICVVFGCNSSLFFMYFLRLITKQFVYKKCGLGEIIWFTLALSIICFLTINSIFVTTTFLLLPLTEDNIIALYLLVIGIFLSLLIACPAIAIIYTVITLISYILTGKTNHFFAWPNWYATLSVVMALLVFYDIMHSLQE